MLHRRAQELANDKPGAPLEPGRSRRSAALETRYVALLRAVNVGGRNKVPMKPLVALCEELGAKQARSYIQSGNVVFSAEPKHAEAFPAQLSEAIVEHFGCKVQVLLRSAQQLAQVAQCNPFLQHGVDVATLHVGFLQAEPDAKHLARLAPTLSESDAFDIRGAELFLHFRDGTANSRFSAAYFERALDTCMTVRNWRTVGALHAMCQE